MTNIHSLLHATQKALVVPKTRKNAFAGYYYRNCEDILEGLKKALPSSCTVTISDDIKCVGERYYIESTATFHCGPESISVRAFAREPLEKKGNDPAQITGATSSYARRYALSGLFCIDDSDDVDSQDNSHKAHAQDIPRPPTAPITRDQVLELIDLIQQAKIDQVTYCQGKKLQRLQDMPARDYAANRAKLMSFIQSAAEKAS